MTLKPSDTRTLFLAVLTGILVVTTFTFFSQNKMLNTQNRSLTERSKAMEAKIADLEKEVIENVQLKKQLENASKDNQSLRSEIEKVKKEAEEKTYLEDILIHKTREIEELKKERAVDLGQISVEAAAALQVPATPEPRTAKNDGHVLAVNEEHGFVVVDFGKTDGVGPATAFAVKKNGKVVGTLKALEIRDIMTACDIKDLTKGAKIEVNDLVSVLK